MTLIRPAIAEDAAGICAILNSIISETTITFAPTQVTAADVIEGLSSHSDRGDPYLVAEEDDTVLGYAKYGPFRSGQGYARTVEITVHLAPSSRGKGLGCHLVASLEQHARAAGIHSLIAGISPENAHALIFHEKLGFERVGVIPEAGHKFDRFIDLVLMQKFV